MSSGTGPSKCRICNEQLIHNYLHAGRDLCEDCRTDLCRNGGITIDRPVPFPGSTGDPMPPLGVARGVVPSLGAIGDPL